MLPLRASIADRAFTSALGRCLPPSAPLYPLLIYPIIVRVVNRYLIYESRRSDICLPRRVDQLRAPKKSWSSLPPVHRQFSMWTSIGIQHWNSARKSNRTGTIEPYLVGSENPLLPVGSAGRGQPLALRQKLALSAIRTVQPFTSLCCVPSLLCRPPVRLPFAPASRPRLAPAPSAQASESGERRARRPLRSSESR